MSTSSPLLDSFENGRPTRPFRTLYGDIVSPLDDVWTVRRDVDGSGGVLSLSIKHFEEVAREAGWAESAINTVTTFVADRLCRRSPDTVHNDLDSARRLAVWSTTGIPRQTFSWADYDAAIGGRFLLHGMKTASRGNDFTRIRVLYRWGTARRLPGFNPAVNAALRSIVAPGNRKGEAVRHRAPDGPLAPDERRQVIAALRDGAGRNEDRAVVMLLLERGSNPRQIARIWNENLVRYDTPSGPFFHLAIPRNKKGNATRETKKASISNRLGTLLQDLQKGAPHDHLLWWLSGRDPVQSINIALKRWVRAARIEVPGDKGPIPLTARRLRYALATDAHEKGASPQVIAELLDHSDLQQVRVYSQNSPGRISRATAASTDPVLEPLVRRFLGQIADDLEVPVVPGLPVQVIPGVVTYLPAHALDQIGGLGKCGHDPRKGGPCGKSPPVACYPCPKFHAYRGAPHQEVRASFQGYIEQNPAGSDPVILSNLREVVEAIDGVIAAIAATPRGDA